MPNQPPPDPALDIYGMACERPWYVEYDPIGAFRVGALFRPIDVERSIKAGALNGVRLRQGNKHYVVRAGKLAPIGE